MILDTHKEIGYLKELGFDEKKAEGIVQLHLKNGEYLATKEDIAQLERVTKADLFATKTELKTDIAQLESKIEKIETKIDTNNKWVMALLLTIFTVLLSEGIGIIIILLSKNP